MNSSDWLAALRRTFPAERIVTDMAELTSYESDALTAYRVRPAAIVFPESQAEVFSLGWLADDTDSAFTKWWGNGERVNDLSAWGGTAYRFYPGDGESFAWVGDWKFIKDVPMVAYFRLKVNENTSSSEVARISVDGGGTTYGPISLKGTDFKAPNQYQEFAIPFINNTNPDNVSLFFNFWRSGSADVYVDGVSIFSAPQAVAAPLTWTVPGKNYRGQGVWVRYTGQAQIIAAEDIGVFAGLAFANLKEYQGKTIELAGDEVTEPQLAETFTRVIGRTVTLTAPTGGWGNASEEEMKAAYEFFNGEAYDADIAALRKIHPGLLNFEQYLRKNGWENQQPIPIPQGNAWG